MPTPFSKTLFALQGESPRRLTLALLASTVLCSAWTAWAVLARVPVYVRSRAARIESAEAAHPIQAAVAGRVTVNHLILGAQITRGDVLLELDGEESRLALAATQAKLEGLPAQIGALRDEVTALATARQGEQQADPSTIAEARARKEAAAFAQRHAELTAERTQRLLEAGLVSRVELERAQADLDRARSEAAERARGLDRTGTGRRVTESERTARLASAQRVLAELEGLSRTTAAERDRLRHDLELRTIRASATGRIADTIPTPAGTFVTAGQKLASLVPEGALVIIAAFDPATAVGRVRAGEPTNVRLDGYPWTQYGVVQAEVTRVGSEVRDASARVELTPTFLPPGIRLEHGLTGTAYVEVERVAPAVLLLRAAGVRLEDGAGAAPPHAGPTPGEAAR